MSDEKKAPAEPTRSVAEHGAGLKGKARHVYAAARVLYGWARHEHHFPGDPIKLTAAEFAEALDRAAKFPGVELLDAAKSKLLGA